MLRREDKNSKIPCLALHIFKTEESKNYNLNLKFTCLHCGNTEERRNKFLYFSLTYVLRKF